MAQRGRKPKPTHLKVVTGNPHQHKINDQEPEAAGPLGAPPEEWSADHKQMWHEIVESAPHGVLTASDHILIETAVRLMAKMRCEHTFTASVASQLRTCLNEMGMTPSARSRLFMGVGAKGNPFSDLD